MKKSIIAGLALTAALSLGACTTPGAPAEQGSALPVATTQSSAAATPVSEDKAMPKFGEQFVWDDNLAVTVKPLGASKASETAAGADQSAGDIFLFEISIVNGTPENFDPALFMADVNYGATGAAASRVFDTAAGIGNSFQGVILPGKQQTVKFAYAIPAADLGDVQMTLSPSIMHTETTFTGAL